MKAFAHDKKFKLKLKYGEVEKPVPNSFEVLIKVVAASINAADYRSIKMGITPKKKIYGSAVAGTIESIGKDVVDFKVGDKVLSDLSDFGFGGLAEYVAIPAQAVTIKPDNLSFEDAASLPVASTTALKAIRDKSNVQKGYDVLIVGAAGGVGTFAVQIAKYYGATVTGVCSNRNIEQTKSIGADKVIDYSTEDFTKSNERYDVIIAVNGNYSLFGYRRALKKGGVYVMVGGSLWQIMKSIFFGWLLSFGSKKMKNLAGKTDIKNLAFVTQLMAEGKIKSVIEKQYAFEDTAEAMSYIIEGHASGKVIINIAEE